MALTASVSRRLRGASIGRFEVVDGAAIFEGGYLALVGPGDAVAARRGRVEPWSAADHQIPLGRALGTVTGNVAASPVPAVAVDLGAGGEILERVTVVGLASRADVGTPVYMTDDDTFTLTKPATNSATRGLVVGYSGSGSVGDVYLHAPLGLAAAPSGAELLPLGHYELAAFPAGAGPADVRANYPAPYHLEILSVHASVTTAPTGGGGTAAINLEIDAVNVTGGVVTVATGDVLGVRKNGTAVTAARRAHEGDAIDVEVTAVTAFTAGAIDLYALVRRLPGV